MSILRRRRIVALSSRRSGPSAGLAVLGVAALVLSACGSTSHSGEPADSDPTVTTSSDAPESVDAPPAVQVKVSANVRKGAQDVPVDKVLTVKAAEGTIKSVTVSAPKVGTVAGEVAADGASWKATSLLEPGAAYTIKTVAEGSDGTPVTTKTRFHTKALTLAEQTYPSVAPLPGETVGVGMPVIVSFDVPVTDKANFEKHMHVTSTPAQPGSWYWISDKEAHWRPKSYWKAGTDVSVKVDVNSVAAGGGIYGQESRDLKFHVGDAHVYKVNTQTDQMKVFSNGKLLRTIPVTTGKAGFTTRSGVKVIIEKFAKHTMNSETIGIGKNNPEYYNMTDVQWAMRMTYSGEFIHAAPWSVSSQGYANVSHGCTGISTANADWLYHLTLRGDVVETTGTDRPMEFGNGYGDWNMSYANYKLGSALS